MQSAMLIFGAVKLAACKRQAEMLGMKQAARFPVDPL